MFGPGTVIYGSMTPVPYGGGYIPLQNGAETRLSSDLLFRHFELVNYLKAFTESRRFRALIFYAFVIVLRL